MISSTRCLLFNLRTTFSILHSVRHPHLPSSALHLSLVPDLNDIFSTALRLGTSPPPLFEFDIVLACAPLSSSSLPPLPHCPPISPGNIVQSSNGLLLSHDSDEHQIIVSNPTTRQSTHICAERESSPGKVVGVSLAFDPSRWPHYYILHVSNLEDDDNDDNDDEEEENHFYVDVYNSATCTWRDEVVCCDNAPFDTDFDRGVYWRGRVFWLSHTESMVYYDLENVSFEKLVLPKISDEDWYRVKETRFEYFGESCGHLHLIEIQSPRVREFNVFELEEEGGELDWFVKYKVDLDVVGCGFENDMFHDYKCYRTYFISILAVVRGDGSDDDGSTLIFAVHDKACSYDFKHSVSRFVIDVIDGKPYLLFRAFQFIESLYCL